MDALARVAGGDTRAVQPTSPASLYESPKPPEIKPEIDPMQVYANLIGGPAPTFGQQYGGLSSASQFSDLVRGGAYNIKLAGELARQEAARLGQPAQETFQIQLDPWETGTLANRRLQENRRVANTPLQALANQMAGGTPTAQDLYGANMARMNAVRGTGDFGKSQMDINAINMATPQAEAQLQQNLRASGALAREELANLIGGLSESEIMRRIAVEQYGYDPALAAGLFPVSEDLDYQLMMQDALRAQTIRETGIDPNETVAETILRTQGIEALNQYQLQQAEYAMNGTPTQQMSALRAEQEAQDALFDDEIRNTYGFDPGRVPNTDPEYVRDLISTNADFANQLNVARASIQDGDDPLDVAESVAVDYIETTNDFLGARVLKEIIASFDLSSIG